MAKVPEGMMANGRVEDPEFADDEELYRRFPPGFLDGETIAIEAIELPDMSVNRQKYGPPEWVVIHEDHQGWGVLGFEVQHIPDKIVQHGVVTFTFEPRHRPHRYNYPHSEVWAFREGEHIDAKNSELLLDPDAHLRWRQRLLWKCRTMIHPE